MYYCAYVNGLNEIKTKLLKTKDELVAEGEPLPEMALI
jgi:hypothetical protein